MQCVTVRFFLQSCFMVQDKMYEELSLLQAQSGLSTDIENMPCSLDDCRRKSLLTDNSLCSASITCCILP